eukprot:729630-Prorocentrum_lima.AAC.1
MQGRAGGYWDAAGNDRHCKPNEACTITTNTNRGNGSTFDPLDGSAGAPTTSTLACETPPTPTCPVPAGLTTITPFAAVSYTHLTLPTICSV